MKFIAIITAKQKSSRFPNKNLQIFKGKSLVENAIISAKKSKYLKEIYVSTDSKKIKKIALKHNLPDIELRSKKYSGLKSSSHSVILHELKKIKSYFDYLVILQPTSPLRTTKDIDDSCKKILKYKDADSLVSCSVIPEEYHLKKIMLKNNDYLSFFSLESFLSNNSKFLKIKKNKNIFNLVSKQSNKNLYVRNGAIYIVKKKNVKKYIIGGKILNFLMPLNKSVDINYKEDLDKIRNNLK